MPCELFINWSNKIIYIAKLILWFGNKYKLSKKTIISLL